MAMLEAGGLIILKWLTRLVSVCFVADGVPLFYVRCGSLCMFTTPLYRRVTGMDPVTRDVLYS